MFNDESVSKKDNTKDILEDLDLAIETHKKGELINAASVYKKTWHKMEPDMDSFDIHSVKACLLGLIKGFLFVGDYLSVQDLLIKLEKLQVPEPSSSFLSQLNYLKGWVAMKKSEYDSAISFLHNSNELKENYAAYKALYNCYVKKHNIQLALSALFKGITLSSETRPERYVKDVTNLAVLLSKNKYPDISFQFMKAVKKKDILSKTSNNTKFGFLFNFVEQNLLLEKYEEAERSCDELTQLLDTFDDNNETKRWKLFMNIKKIKLLTLAGRLDEANKLKLRLYAEKSRLNGSLLFICGHYSASNNVKVAEQLLKKNPKDIFSLLVLLIYNLESYKGTRDGGNTLTRIKVYADKILRIDNTNVNALLCLVHAFIFTEKIKEASNLFSEIYSERKAKMRVRNSFEFKLTGAHIFGCFKDNNIIRKFHECEALTSNVNERAEIVHYIVNYLRKNGKNYHQAVEILESFMNHWDNTLNDSIKLFTKFVYCTMALEQLSRIDDMDNYKIVQDKVEAALDDLLRYKPNGTRVFKTVTDNQIVLSSKQLKDYFEKCKGVMNNKILG